MLRQMLYTQWKWSRLELAVYAVYGFVVPTIAMKAISLGSGAVGDTIAVSDLLSASSGTGGALIVLCVLCAVSLAARPWIADDACRHSLALSLPVSWSAYVRLRFAAGAILLFVPTLAVWFGSTLAGLSLSIPDSLHVYPTSIAARFLASALVMYAATFALQYVTGRKAARVVAAAIVVLLVIEGVVQLATGQGIMLRAFDTVTSWPGPFEVVAARWMLVDV